MEKNVTGGKLRIFVQGGGEARILPPFEEALNRPTLKEEGRPAPYSLEPVTLPRMERGCGMMVVI